MDRRDVIMVMIQLWGATLVKLKEINKIALFDTPFA